MEDSKKNIFKNGATWLRADFHLHTKADKEFIYNDDQNDFCRFYIDKLKEQKIQIGVITNHNKFDKGEFVNLKKNAKKEGIGLFAGVELSVNDGSSGVHILIVFDEQWYKYAEDFIQQFLIAAFEGIANRENENTNCRYSFEIVLEKLNEHRNQGRDSFIILAHVEEEKGFFKGFDGTRIQTLRNNHLFRDFVLGFQKVRTNDEVNKWKQWFQDKLPAFVEGSDCKSLEKIGRPHTQKNKEKKTFIKIGDFNFEALRFALKDHEYRVSAIDKPEIKNGYIKSIFFEGGLLEGINLNFSPELNTLIGIRGSGKSSLLEVLRYVLGINPSNVADQNYKNLLVERSMGSGGKAIVTIVNKQKEEYRIKKIYNQKEEIWKDEVLQSGISLEATGFSPPIYFGQKDLSNKGDDFENDLIQRLIGTKLQTVQKKIEQKQTEIKHLIFELQKLKNLEELKKETETKLKNAEHKLTSFKEKGVEDKLKEQAFFDSDLSKVRSIDSTVTNYLDDLNKIISNYGSFFQEKMTGSEINRDFFDEAQIILQKTQNEFQNLKDIYNNSILNQEQWKKIITKMDAKKDSLKEDFAKIKREINTDSINPDTYLTLKNEIDLLCTTLKEIEKYELKRNELGNHLLNSLTELDTIWREENTILNHEVKKINEAESKISLEVIFKGRKDKFKGKLMEVFKGSNIREYSYTEITEQYDDFIQIYKDSAILKKILTNENQFVEFNKILEKNLSDLLTFKVENKIMIQYNNKPLEQHSLGQRASALILFLLVQKENDVLIIDQPEDDLDNQTIYNEVIKELKKIKGNMQFIFATHNANIPVLGDSENVLSCTYSEKKIIVETGTMDHHETQKRIIDIMEGGEEAFNRRKNIYDIWNIKK